MKYFFLLLLTTALSSAFAQNIPYGNNPAAGKYLNVGDTRLYYEVYGTGSPLLLLHGDTFGYIDEFENYIPLLSQHYKVIAVAMRGHGKSGIGTKQYSYQLFAQDALKVLANEGESRASVLGFSAGAITAYYLAAYHPKKITKVVAMGGLLDRSGYKPSALKELKTLSGANCEKMLPELVKSRKALMPEPTRYNDLINKLRNSWLQPVYIDKRAASGIKCSVLIVGGDSDEYISLDEFLKAHRTIPHARLAIIPGCGHVGLLENKPFFETFIIPFLLKEK